MTQKTTPMMEQYFRCKKEAPDAIVFFRLGDFFEAFYDDAVLLNKELGLTLTKRQDIPMSGVPAHTCEGYVEKLVNKGYIVAIADQVEAAKPGTGLVKREIVKILSPGTMLESSILEKKTSNYFASLHSEKGVHAMTLIDISTGEMRTLETPFFEQIASTLGSKLPSEILTTKQYHDTHLKALNLSCRTNFAESDAFHIRLCQDHLLDHFKVHTLAGLGLEALPVAIVTTSALLLFMQNARKLPIEHIETLFIDTLSDFMLIDTATQRNLELIETSHRKDHAFTLFNMLDMTSTSMGSRTLKRWLMNPLLSLEKINKRQDSIEALIKDRSTATAMRDLLKEVRDIERLIMRIATGFGTPRDISSLRFSLEHAKALLPLIEKIPCLKPLTFDPLDALIHLIETQLVDTPPLKLHEGGVIRPGVHQELDELRAIKSGSQEFLVQYQTSLREETGIKNLKISFNKAFGYFIEVSRGAANKMPLSFQRRQTLVNNERFISPELKEYEEKIYTAQDKISVIEQDLYAVLKESVASYRAGVLKVGKVLGILDAFLSLSLAAHTNNFSRPTLDRSHKLLIKDGRHPIIEYSLPSCAFIPNDTTLDKTSTLHLITGPNMAGKSTYIRQVALITILAQIGSFVPAQSAHIGLVDKIFSRIGAHDDLSRGQSTFMLEMTETAHILNNATSSSLVILDEIGRGTSTYDGVAIAWSVAEHLALLHARTLFATHYWELSELETLFPNIHNYNVTVKETQDSILFLHKIAQGGTDKSYGIHVACLAGVPPKVIKRAREKLQALEQTTKAPTQPSLFEYAKPDNTFVEKLQELSLNQMTPMQALETLHTWQNDAL